MKNPTNPDSANESSAASSQLDSTLMTIPTPTPNNMLTTTAALTPGATGLSAATPITSNPMIGGYGDGNFDFFDPQHWMLDGLLDFNYSYVPPLESA